MIVGAGFLINLMETGSPALMNALKVQQMGSLPGMCHALGTGTNQENIADTTLQADSGLTRVAGTQTAGASNNIYKTVATFAFLSSLAITEHGVFTAATLGVLLDRSVFAAINVNNGDSIDFIYQLTLTPGG